MKYRDAKEDLTFLALIAFFGSGLLLSREFVFDNSAWDYIVVQLLSIMNGLGLVIVLILWTVHILGKKSQAQDTLPVKLSKGYTNKCG